MKIWNRISMNECFIEYLEENIIEGRYEWRCEWKYVCIKVCEYKKESICMQIRENWM